MWYSIRGKHPISVTRSFFFPGSCVCVCHVAHHFHALWLLLIFCRVLILNVQFCDIYFNKGWFSYFDYLMWCQLLAVYMAIIIVDKNEEWKDFIKYGWWQWNILDLNKKGGPLTKIWSIVCVYVWRLLGRDYESW